MVPCGNLVMNLMGILSHFFITHQEKCLMSNARLYTLATKVWYDIHTQAHTKLLESYCSTLQGIKLAFISSKRIQTTYLDRSIQVVLKAANCAKKHQHHY